MSQISPLSSHPKAPGRPVAAKPPAAPAPTPAPAAAAKGKPAAAPSAIVAISPEGADKAAGATSKGASAGKAA